ncbi:NAD(P)-binding protein [Ganoderma leucocontextum]|nr:NAD(P)-binding protein [Ganoderma leucocontextum]
MGWAEGDLYSGQWQSIHAKAYKYLKVLVTGANGYVAAWVIKDLLEHGYAVRGTVRSESKATYLREYFKAFGNKLEIVIVEDITAVRPLPSWSRLLSQHFPPHAFPALYTGWRVRRTCCRRRRDRTHASLVSLSDGDPSEISQPAGTRTVLASALLHRTRVRRVFITAALTAGTRVDPQGRTSATIDESSWDEDGANHCEEKGRDAEPLHKYRASKVLAERAAWEFHETAKKELGEKEEALGWDLVVFCPLFVFGPVVYESPSLETFGSTQADWYKRVVRVKGETGGAMGNVTLMKFGVVCRFGIVDVRDLARAFVLGLENLSLKEEAGGERFIICSFRACWQDFSE